MVACIGSISSEVVGKFPGRVGCSRLVRKQNQMELIMGWARQQADKAKINKILRRCKNTKHTNKKRKVWDNMVLQESRNADSYR
jgi:hypothetical protein